MSSVSKLIASLKELGVKPNIDTFSGRKRNQKLAYLIQEVAGVPLGYHFTWYIHGPYSPNLTRDLYAETGDKALASVRLTSEDKEKVSKLGEFLGDYVKSSDSLELLVSLHFLRKLGKEYETPKEEVIGTLKEKKPFFSEQEIIAAWLKLETLEKY